MDQFQQVHQSRKVTMIGPPNALCMIFKNNQLRITCVNIVNALQTGYMCVVLTLMEFGSYIYINMVIIFIYLTFIHVYLTKYDASLNARYTIMVYTII